MSRVKTLVKRLSLLLTVVCIVGCDRVSKHVATEVLAGEPTQSYFFDVVRLSYAENPGSFLSLGAELPDPVRFILFTFGAGILLCLFIAHAIRARWSGASLLGLVMFVAGGASNWVDRLSDGRVVDFLNVGIGPIRTGIFNVADMAILAGVAILLFSQYSRGRKQRHGQQRSA
jgi:signal peptidase II